MSSLPPASSMSATSQRIAATSPPSPPARHTDTVLGKAGNLDIAAIHLPGCRVGVAIHMQGVAVAVFSEVAENFHGVRRSGSELAGMKFFRNNCHTCVNEFVIVPGAVVGAGLPTLLFM